MYAGTWILAALIAGGEWVGFVNRGHSLGWLGLSVAGAGLVAVIPLANRLDRSAEGSGYTGSFVGLLMLALPVLIILSTPLPSGIQFWLIVACGVLVFGVAAYLERKKQ